MAISLKCLILYYTISIVTIPFLNAIWWGELPVLAVPQLPKILVAGWLRKEVVMPLIGVLGLSKGSFSPDFILARPYALALVYLLPTLGLLIAAYVRREPARRYVPLAGLLALATFFDYLATLKFADQPALTIY